MAKGILRAAALAAGIVALGAVAAPPRAAVADGAGVSIGVIRADLPISLPVDACLGPSVSCGGPPRTHDVPEFPASTAGPPGGPVSEERVSTSRAGAPGETGGSVPAADGTAARQAPPESGAMTYISAGRQSPAGDEAGAVGTFAVAGLLALAAGVLRTVRRGGS
ncbi:MAG: hypothetical protein FWJ90_08845 [Actinomadura sp.]